MTLTVVVITKNESRNIKDCLESVAWADERIVVDAESQDGTADIARKMDPPVKVFTRPWPGFGPQKNFGIAQSSSDWILILDADECVPPDLQREIQNTIRQDPHHSDPDVVAYRIPRRNILWGHWLRYGVTYPDYQLRLFLKGAAQYNDIPIHENLMVQGPIGTLRHPLDHYSEPRIEDHMIKMDGYTTLAAQQKRTTVSYVWWYHLVINPLVIWFKVYVLKLGMLDGVPGLINSIFSSLYTFLKYAKTWEMSRESKEPRQRP